MKITRISLILVASALSSLSAAAQMQPASATITPTRSYRPWIGPDGKPLPFKSDAEVLEFLRTASVISEKEIPTGVTGPHKLMLEKDGVRASAVFRQVDEQRSDMQFSGGAHEMNFRDSYLFEPAAYELAKLLGLDNVPPAELRKIAGRDGSIQIWVEQAMTEDKRIKQKLVDPNNEHWAKEVHLMMVFDALVYNTDRNQGNLLITPDWKLWFIDHTRAFRRYGEFPQGTKLSRCDRRLLEHLKTLDANTVHERLKPYLHKSEIDAVLKRRDRLVKYFTQLIAEKGEDKVLYDSEPGETQ